jgi:D-threonate/D-erythronate kinase
MTAGLIADDLTGSLDGGLQLFRKGFPVSVYFPWVDPPPLSDAPGFLVVDTESRNLSAGEAVKRTGRAVTLLDTLKLPLIYKKVDSTLRGNTGVEIAAILDISSFDAAIVIPALPKLGRTVKDGILLLDGIPLADTEFSQDPLSPVRSSIVSELISQGTPLECRPVSQTALTKGCKDPVGLLESYFTSDELSAGKPVVLIIDSETDEDLQRVSMLAAGLGPRVLPCGSAGLLEHIAGEMENTRSSIPGTAVVRKLGSAPVLIVSASMSAVTRRQIEHIVTDGAAVRVKPDNPATLAVGKTTAKCTRQVIEAVAKGKNVVLDAGGRREELPGNLTEVSERSTRLLEYLSEVIVKVFESTANGDLGGLILAGGDTAITVCKALNAGGIRITGECEPFVPAGSVIGGMADGLPVVTKAGGFGTDTVFTDACKYLSGQI